MASAIHWLARRGRRPARPTGRVASTRSHAASRLPGTRSLPPSPCRCTARFCVALPVTTHGHSPVRRGTQRYSIRRSQHSDLQVRPALARRRSGVRAPQRPPIYPHVCLRSFLRAAAWCPFWCHFLDRLVSTVRSPQHADHLAPGVRYIMSVSITSAHPSPMTSPAHARCSIS